jgi:dCMP deaminase
MDFQLEIETFRGNKVEHSSEYSKWHRRFLQMAALVATWSKDPSTKVGAVAVHPATHRVISVGYNGFPTGIEDTQDRLQQRDLKYNIILHAEENLILTANKSIAGAAIYTWPFLPCSLCASRLIQAGASAVFAPVMDPSLAERWDTSVRLSKSLFDEAGVYGGTVGVAMDYIVTPLSDLTKAASGPSTPPYDMGHVLIPGAPY